MNLGKFYITNNSHEESIKLQKLLFSLGYEWNGSMKNIVWTINPITNYTTNGAITNKKIYHGASYIYDDVKVYDYNSFCNMVNRSIRKKKLKKINKKYDL
jgi:predicted hydrocarbon binding protein